MLGTKLLVYRTSNSATITGSWCYMRLFAGRWSLAVPGVGLVVAVGTSLVLIANPGWRWYFPSNYG